MKKEDFPTSICVNLMYNGPEHYDFVKTVLVLVDRLPLPV